MTVYLVDRILPGITIEQLAAAQGAAIATTEQFRAEGRDVRYLRSIFVPGDAHCMCLFEAPDAEVVKAVNDTAQIPYTAVLEALDLPQQTA
jgi:hypothetical protein